MSDEDPLSRANPVPPESLDSLPLRTARAELREEIMAHTRPDASTPDPEPRPSRGWLTPLAAAAAVVLVAGGVWAITVGSGDDDPTPAADSPRASESASPSASASTGSSASASADPSAPKERYEMPARPMLITAPGWNPDVVDGADITWAGPDGATVTVEFTTLVDEDPFSYHQGPRFRSAGEQVQVLDTTTRLTSYRKDGEERQVALTAPVLTEDGTAFLFEGTGLTRPEFQKVLDSAQWVNLGEYDRVIKPAVG